MCFYHLIGIYVTNYMLLIICCISLCCTGSKYLWAVQFIRSKTIEPAVQPVPNGWTSEPVNRQPHRFDVWSGPNNCDCNSRKRVQICHLLYRASANAGACTVCVLYSPFFFYLCLLSVVGQRLSCSTVVGKTGDWSHLNR